MHWIGSAEDPLLRTTLPGVATTCGPFWVRIVQVAPGTPGVSMATVWVVPLVMVAQAASSKANEYTHQARMISPPAELWWDIPRLNAIEN